jgi:hypothetical protein
MSRTNSELFGAGRISEVAFYDGSMNQTDATSLYNSGAGVDARTVQGGSLFYYWQLCGTASPETALVGGVNHHGRWGDGATRPIAGICGVGALAPAATTSPQSALGW